MKKNILIRILWRLQFVKKAVENETGFLLGGRCIKCDAGNPVVECGHYGKCPCNYNQQLKRIFTFWFLYNRKTKQDEKNNYEKFVAFLKENDCYDEFLKNYNNDSDNSWISLEQYCVKSPTATSYISGAFLWNDTYIKFWDYLDCKWRKELKNNKL